MTRREWRQKIYQGMAIELEQQAFDLGATWLTMEDGDPYPEPELRRMKDAAMEIIMRFRRLGGSRTDARGRKRFPDIG